MLRTFARSGDERKVDIGCGCGRKLFFCLLSRFFQSLKGHLVSGKIYAFCFLEFINQPLCHSVIKVVTAQTCIAVGSENFNYAVADLDDGYIERTAAQIIYHNLLLFFIVKTVGQRCRRRLVDDTFYIQSCNSSGIFRSLTLSIVKVGRNRDNGLRYFFSQIAFGVCFQFLKNHSGNFLWSIFLVVD